MDVLRFADIAGEFERPRGQLWRMWPPIAPGTLVRSTADGSIIAIKLGRGLGVWERDTGRLVWSDEHAGHATFHPERGELLLVRNGTLTALAFPTMAEVGKVRLHQDAAHQVESASGRHLVTLLSDGNGKTGYQIFQLVPKPRRLSKAHHPTGADMIMRMPVFTPDERLVVVLVSNLAWWTPDGADEPATPAAGGPVTVGVLVLHRVDGDTATTHRLRVDLPAGWLPADPHDEDGNAGPEIGFPGDGLVRLALPDADALDLPLDDLPEHIDLPAPSADRPPRARD